MNHPARVFEIDGNEVELSSRTYTVTGLLDLGTSPSSLYVAGVVEGERPTHDTDSHSTLLRTLVQKIAARTDGSSPNLSLAGWSPATWHRLDARASRQELLRGNGVTRW
ncbi:hypothetical protein J2853_002672 [Streptosporangium lutulentum]|uniref:Uncharacterized protein n=1 Tax=Streptosporangium lutulentum TaxID=1461250 RepID=A0ABT9Q9M7_9ACTN|nr:hypothetical protein [Streptosporangium lutulentum]